jgi:hypothetical protein
MSDRIAGVVCEGQTDFPVLEAIIFKLWPEVSEVRALQPELDDEGRARRPAGWTQVRAWCEQNADSLDELLDAPLIGDPLDLLVVAIDVDIAVDANVADPPKQVGAYETKRLHDVIRQWLQGEGRRAPPAKIVITTPVRAIEAWIIAALFPKQKGVERIANTAEFLVHKKKLRRGRDGKPWKELHLYRGDGGFGQRVARSTAHVRKACTEAERTFRAIERLRGATEK